MQLDNEILEEPCAPKLLSLAADSIIRNCQLLLADNQIEFRQHDVEAIFKQVRNYSLIPDQSFFKYFVAGERMPTSSLFFGSNLISDETFVKLLVGQEKTLQEVDLSGNKSLGSKLLLDYLLKSKDRLPKLTSFIASSQWIFSMYKDMMSADKSNESIELPTNSKRTSSTVVPGDVSHLTQFFPHLKRFRHNLMGDYCYAFESQFDFMTRVLLPLEELEILELGKWNRLETMDFLLPLSSTLTVLRLYDCPDIKIGIDNIMKLSNLEVLDIAQATTANGMFSRPASTLYELISALPKLKKLDISNTNLCYPFAENEDRPERLKHVETDVHGLTALHSNLEFLSVFHCDNISPSTKLPAFCVASELTETHLIVALQTYMDRPEILQMALNEIFQLYRLNSEEAHPNNVEGLYLILEALSRHRFIRALQIPGTAALFYAIRNTPLSPAIKHRVVDVMLDAMDAFSDEPVIVRNSCLSFCQLDIPKDVVFVYSKIVMLLVRVLNSHNSDSTTPRVAIYLLNSLACQTGHESKVEVGVYGAIQAVMSHIDRKIERQICDETVEVSWSFLWNITDETAANCDLFFKSNGLSLFLRCYKEWSMRKDLVRNMLGLIGNVAEVDHLRVYLMNDNLIKIFLDLLDVLYDGIETSYNSAGILAQLLSDNNWENVTISRQFIANQVIETTKKWALDARRFINYRSFAPILRLIPLNDSPASQIWALFAIANLTTTDREKYCDFVVNEGGVPLLHQIQHSSNELMVSYANIILNNISSQRSDNSSIMV